MSNTAFSTLLGTDPTNIETVNGNYLILRNNNLKADGAPSDFINQLAQFYIDIGTDSNNDTLYRIRPVSQTGKYLALSADRKSIILEDIPVTLAISDSSHDFIVRTANADYIKFEDRYSNGQRFVSIDANDDVILAGDSSSAWFRLKFLTNITNTTSSALNSAPGFLDLEFGKISARMNVNDRLRATEE